MQYRHQITVDVEDTLRQDIPEALEGAFSIFGAAPPVPESLGSNLPLVIPERIGGSRYSLVLDAHSVAFDVYAATWGEAQEAAGQVVAAISELPYRSGLAGAYYSSEITTLPYNNPDPRHPDIPRVSVNAQVITRAKSI